VLAASDLEFIGRLSVFAGIEPEVMQLIGRLGQRVECEGEEVLFREGDPAKEMLVVLSGRLDVYKSGPEGQHARIASLGPGDVAGEMSLIDIQPRSAELRTVGPTSIVVLSHGDIAEVYREDPEAYLLLVRNIAREISLRLRRLDTAVPTMIFETAKAASSRSK